LLKYSYLDLYKHMSIVQEYSNSEPDNSTPSNTPSTPYCFSIFIKKWALLFHECVHSKTLHLRARASIIVRPMCSYSP
jgi:hypothetical protein